MSITVDRFQADLLKQGPLTLRQSQVLRSLCTGKGVKEIAAEIAAAPHTVEIHLENIGTRLGVRGMLQIALAGVAYGLVRVSRRGVQAVFALVVSWQVAGMEDGLRARTHRARAPTARVQLMARNGVL